MLFEFFIYLESVLLGQEFWLGETHGTMRIIFNNGFKSKYSSALFHKSNLENGQNKFE